ncbi:MAG TPA: methyltransferase dimerization domain-containing protein, partial [Methylomirabilota bacterium]|nr:methyltransferase dimerization domain-containing protein [Methylomirabilota bacterium]
MAADAPRPDTTRLQRLVHSYRDAATLMAAVELGLFTHVARGADTEAALTRALDVTPTNAERLVTACVALGLLVRDGEAGNGRLRNAPDVARFLVEGEPAYAGPWMLFSKPDWNEWGRLGTHLRRRDTV